MLGHSPDQPTGQVDRIRATARTLVADVTTDHTGALTGTAESVVSDSVAGVPGRPGKAETARRWNELVHSYSASGTDNLLYRVPDRIQRPLGPTAHRERARIDALMRRQASVTASIAAGPSAPSAARPSPTPLPSPSPRALLPRSSVWSPSPSGGASDVQRVQFADIPHRTKPCGFST